MTLLTIKLKVPLYQNLYFPDERTIEKFLEHNSDDEFDFWIDEEIIKSPRWFETYENAFVVVYPNYDSPLYAYKFVRLRDYMAS